MGMIARIRVEYPDGLTEFPIAQAVKGGWQNGVRFYRDELVTEVQGTYHPNRAEVTEEEIAAAMQAVPIADVKIGITPHGISEAIKAVSAYRESSAWRAFNEAGAED